MHLVFALYAGLRAVTGRLEMESYVLVLRGPLGYVGQSPDFVLSTVTSSAGCGSWTINVWPMTS